MADLAEVADTVVGIIAGLAYPNGLQAASVGNCDIMAYQGWPDPKTLQADLTRGKVHVSVFPRPGGKVTTVMLGDTDWVEVDNNGTTGTSALEIVRQNEVLQVTIWANAPTLRDIVAKSIVPGMALTTRFNAPDGSQVIMTRAGMIQIDKDQKSNLYRRDLLYSVNYATTFYQPGFAILHTQAGASGGPTDTTQGTVVTATT